MTQELQLRISGMDCADCALKLEKAVAKIDGINSCQVNFTTAQMKIDGTVNEEAVAKKINSLGYGITAPNAQYTPRTTRQQLFDLLRQPRNTATLIGAVFIFIGFLSEWFFDTPVITLSLFLTGGLFGLYFPAKSGWGALRSGQGLDINVLMTLAAVGAFAIGEYAEAATVIILFSLGEALEGYTLERARDSIRSLTQLAPAEATVLRPCMDCEGCKGQSLPDGSGIYESGPCPWCDEHEQVIPVEELAIGDRIIVKPGERIPMDGRVHSGSSAVNQAPITGESMPVEKITDADVFAGTINGDGLLDIEVTHLAKDNTLSRLIHLVEEAQSQKTPTQRFVDKFARVYTPMVVIIAALVAIVPPLLFGQPFLDTPDTHGWLYRALTLLVIACPCALVIATPVAVVSGISSAARRGVLIKGGAFLEALGRIKIIAFDKTGTLTQGRPQLVDIACIHNGCAQLSSTDCEACNDILSKTAAVERYSTHPLAQAITQAANNRQLPTLNAQQVKNLPGRGVQGEVAGQLITVGSHTMLHSNMPQSAQLHQRITQAEAMGQTTMLVREDDTLRGYMAVSDPPRLSSKPTIAALKATGVSRTVMLTGDNPSVAQAVGQQLGIDDVRAGLMPQDKVAVVRELVNDYGDTVAMVGDGVNDAPALAAASVGIAMGAGGTAQALETADVALMGDDLTQLPVAIRQGQKASRIIYFNIWFALIIKAIFLLAAISGVATLWMAVFADMGASLLVTLNGMRLLKK